MRPCKGSTLTLLLVTLITAPAGAQIDTGSANLTAYVSIGDSLAAGYSSGSLHLEGQAVSFPSLISLLSRGSADFEQPLILDPGIPNILTLTSLSPVVISPKPGQGLPINFDLERPYDNLAVPGARVGDVVRTRGGGLHDVVLRGLGTQLELAAALEPTFATLWVGNNDILAAAVSGIVIEGLTLTPVAQFEADFRTIVGTLDSIGVEGLAMATIPSVVSIPYVTAIPPVVVDPATNQPVLIDGQPVPLIGPDGPLAPGDFVLLPASADLAQGVGIPASLGGSGRPLSDGSVLSASEAARIEARREEFNDIIQTVANEAGAALVDAAEVYDTISREGLLWGRIRLSTDFLTGGLFSYDGVHPSPIGYAIVANAFIDSINSTYGASISKVSLASFLLGGLGRLPGTGTSVGATEGDSFVFSASAYTNLRRVLNVPKEKRLIKIKNRRARRAASSGMVPAPADRSDKALGHGGQRGSELPLRIRGL